MMRKTKKETLTPVELEIMKAIWEISESGTAATTSNVRKKITGWREEAITGQQIQGYVARLEEMGFLKIVKDDTRNRYIPLIDQDTYIGKQTKYWADFWNKSGAGYALMALSNAEKPTEKELEELKRYLDELY